MKKITLISLLACSSLIHAGCMGGDCGTSDSPFGASTFFSLQGGYVQNKIDGYNITISGTQSGTVTSTESNKKYGARLGIGAIVPVNDQVGVTGEVGWGYYGKSTLTPVFTGVFAPAPGTLQTNYSFSGFDALVGVAFTQPYFSIFLKAGALVQNMSTKSTSNFFAFDPNNAVEIKSNNTAALPELKVGGAYNFSENWAITLDYLIALGGKNHITGDFNSDTSTSTLNVNTQNPTLNALMFGVQYTV